MRKVQQTLSAALPVLAMLFLTSINLYAAPPGGGTGVVTVTAAGGSCIGYTPAQGGGPDNWEVAQGGSYNITITNVTECTGSAIKIFFQNSNIGNFCITANKTSTGTYAGSFTMPNPACFTTPISYKCDANGGCDNSNTFNAKGPSGSTTVHLRASNFDANCNKTSTDEDCTVGTTCNLSLSETQVNVACHGGNTGSIDITASGAQGSVTYLWNDGVTTEDRSGLAAGSYSVTATDAAGCKITSETFEITEPDALGISGTPIDVTTVGGTNGSINVTVTGGTTTYTYLWNDGATTEDRTGLPAGNYSVTVTDHNGCTIGKSFTIHEPECNIAVSGTKVNITCHDAGNGSINITVTGNNGTVTYLWNDNNTSEDRTGLSAGSYSVTATDAAGCHITSETFTITEPDALGISGTPLDVTTVGGSDGSIDVTVTGGTTNYAYLWNDGETTEDRTGLPAGNYNVTVTDHNGCTIGKSFIIHEPTCNIAIDGSKNDITCNGSSNGSIDITVTGSNGSVTYLWNDNATGEDRTGLSAGSYSVTATDAAGCHITSETFTITEPDALGISGTPLDVTTVGGSDGSIDVTVTGGTTNYTYLWNDGVTTEDRSGLPAGNYSVTVTDHNGCTIGKSFIIHEPTCNIAISGVVTKVTCFGGNNGAINVTVTGNSGAVSYLWNDNVTTEDRSNLVAGTYSVKATDAAGCSVTSSNFTVTQGKKIKITATVTPQTTKNACDGTASLSATGGTAPYVFTWNDGYVGATRTGLCMGTYTITVTDKKGCPATCKVKIACSPAIAQSTNGQESITAGSTSFSVAVSPNPTKGLIRVSVNAVTAGNATINVYDLTGRILISNKINVVKGTNMQELNLEKLAKGLYQVQIAADNNSKTFKIILE